MRTKVWLIIVVSLVLIGCIIFGGVMSMLKWDFTKLSFIKYENNTYEISENYNNISITTNTADIVFVASESASVSCYEHKSVKHSVTVKDSTLVIEVVDTRKWYEHISIYFSAPKITVYLPQGEYGTLSIKSATGCVEIPNDFKFRSIDISESTGDVTNYASVSEDIKIQTSTGNICVENISVGALDLSVSTGKVTVSKVNCDGDIAVGVSTGNAYLTDITCKNAISSGSTGNISLKNVIATEKFTIERSTGNVNLDSCDASEILIETDTGNVKGSLLTEKVFITQTDTGDIDVPKTINGGKCEINTNTGNVEISLCR